MKGAIFEWALGVGLEVSRLLRAGKRPGALLAAQHALADRLVFQKVRALFGGRLRFFVSGSAPLSREIAEFFDAFGVVILEGYGLTESSAATHANLPWARRIGTVGTPFAGIEMRIAADGEILHARPVDHARLPRPPRADARGARRGRAGSTPATSGSWTPTATSPSPTARRTSSRPPAGSTSRPTRARGQAQGALAVDRAGARARRPPELRLRARHARRRGDPALGGGERPRREDRRAAVAGPGGEGAPPAGPRPAERFAAALRVGEEVRDPPARVPRGGGRGDALAEAQAQGDRAAVPRGARRALPEPGEGAQRSPGRRRSAPGAVASRTRLGGVAPGARAAAGPAPRAPAPAPQRAVEQPAGGGEHAGRDDEVEGAHRHPPRPRSRPPWWTRSAIPQASAVW